MSRNLFEVPAKPAKITLDTLPQLFAHHRARFDGWSMTQTPPEPGPAPPGTPPAPAPPAPPAPGAPPADAPPERPADIAETEWNTLGDPGKRAIVRERARADAAERALAASRARPAPPKADAPAPGEPGAPAAPAPTPPAPTPGQGPDIAKLVTEAVTAAVKPILDREEQRDLTKAAEKVQQAVFDAAKPRLHDATDALASIDLTTVVDEHGRADLAKVATAIDDLVKRKPHLAKAGERLAPPGIGGGGPVGSTDGEKVKAVLADMQKATGVRPAAAGTTS